MESYEWDSERDTRACEWVRNRGRGRHKLTHTRFANNWHILNCVKKKIMNELWFRISCFVVQQQNDCQNH